MDEAEALAVGRRAVKEALKKHGDNKELAAKELEGRARTNETLRKALEVAGLLDLQRDQAIKH